FTSTEQNPTVTAEGVYTLVVTAENGCEGRESVFVDRDECGECPPMIISCPGDVTVQCAEDFSPYGVGGSPEYREGDIEDGEGKKCPKIIDTGWYDEYLSACPFVIRRTFYAVDEDGMLETCSQTITVIDEVAPIFENVPADLTISCDGNLDDVPMPDVWAYDECTKTEMPAWLEVTRVNGDCASEYDLIHTWSSTDYCGNTGTAQWTIHVIDNEAPTLFCEVEDMKVCCDDVPEPVECSAKDNCDPDVVVHFSEKKTKGDCEKGYVITRTWTAVDACGNASAQEQIIQVIGEKECKGYADEAPLVTEEIEPMIEVVASPNPFRGQTMISILAKKNGNATVIITDLQGRHVSEAFNGAVSAGEAVRVEFSPKDHGAGTYIYRVRMEGFEVRGRLVHNP
ncbi:MAG: T9SS type A sorting domain-containing protein, partial [Flavobacteriales bacterium]|nr:T9SS type A sorting domain-containing protein [Flavobacteriales bacterium]